MDLKELFQTITKNKVSMAYRDMIQNIAKSINGKFDQILAKYNFDFGDEFEIALCRLLREILPEKYGICRGFVITENGNFAGDDVIIYARDRFPTIRSLEYSGFAQKEHIPIEAVYCYIEAKHTLYLGADTGGQSLNKALEQVGQIKSLQREKRSIFSIDPYNTLEDQEALNRENWPDHDNPMFTAIISRFVVDNTADCNFDTTPAKSVDNIEIPPDCPPDLIVMGQNDILFPGLSSTNTISYDSPFFVPGKSTLIHKRTENSALAIGIIMILYALDTIKLGKMPYKSIIRANL